MKGQSSARDSILAAIGERLGRDRPAAQSPAEGARVPGTPSGLDSPAARLERFRSVLERVGGQVSVVSDADAAAAELERIVIELGAREVAISDAPLVCAAAARLPGDVAVFDGWLDRARLAGCDLGLTSAQWGVAETGTLVLDSGRERHRLVSLVPPVHVAILESDVILSALGEALAAQHPNPPDAGGGAPPAYALTLITGPSRTADIELTLVVGVHGPKELRVIVIDRNSG